jgi:hypothetical protein
MKFYKITQKKKGEELYHINSEATFITFSIELMGVIIYILYDPYRNTI